MGLTTLEQFRAELSHTLGDKVRDNTLLDLWINRAYFEVANTGNQQHLRICAHVMTVQDEAKYILPEDLYEILSVADMLNKRRLIRTDDTDYHLKDREARGGRLAYYYRRAGEIMFWPIPAKPTNVELIYIEQPDALTVPTQRSVLPNIFDHAIALFAARNGMISLHMDEEATLRHQSAVAYLREQNMEMDHAMGSLKEGFGVAHSFEDLTRQRTSTP